jgi:sucrose-6-phosphate hydrolase SacC (GH32 family)
LITKTHLVLEVERPPPVAIYTNHTETNQSQHIAFSNDDGLTWSKYGGNPVLDWNLAEFRDPKVMWDEKRGHWPDVTCSAARTSDLLLLIT